MDPHAASIRHRAARTLDALAAIQRAYREAVTTPTSKTPGFAGRLNVTTPRARDHPRTITIGADEAHHLLRSSTPRNFLKPDRRAHLELQEALALAMERLGQMTDRTPGPDALAAARLAARKLAQWIKKHDGRAAAPRVSTRRVLTHKNPRSQSVLTPATPAPSQATPASDPIVTSSTVAAERHRRRVHAEAFATAQPGAAAAPIFALHRLPSPHQEIARPCPAPTPTPSIRRAKS